MIITLNIDTEKDKEIGAKVLEVLLGAGCPVDLEFISRKRIVGDVYEAARRRSAGEKVIYKEEPKTEHKRRGRPRKEKAE